MSNEINTTKEERQVANTIDMGTKFSDVLELENFVSLDNSTLAPAMYLNYIKKPLLVKATRFLMQELAETLEAIETDDNNEIVDGFGDVAFIALNGIYKTFRTQGQDHETATKNTQEVMYRICSANLGKLQSDGTVLKVNGKVQKPEGWKAPDHSDLFK